MTGRRGLIAPAVVVGSVTLAVVALGDSGAEVSKGAVAIAAGAVAVLIVVVATGIEHRDQHPFPFGVLMMRLSPIPAVLLVMLVIWLLPDSDQPGGRIPDLGGETDDDAPADEEGDEPGIQPSDIIDAVYTVFLVAAVVLGLFLARRLIRSWSRQRRRPAAPGATGSVTESDDPERWRREVDRRVVRSGLERGRAALLDESDPRLAIIAAYLAFEDHVRGEGLVRDPAETQREYAARVLAAGDVSEPEHVTELVELFNAARFSTEPLGEDDAVAAHDHIDALVGD